MPGGAWPSTAGTPRALTSPTVATAPRLVLQQLDEALPPVTSTGSFDTAAASWDATASERFTSTSAFVQAGATWGAAATSIQPVTATGSFAQTATWTGQGTSLQAAITGTASFVQVHGLSGQVVLKIIGYASRTMPPEFTDLTGITPEDIAELEST